MALQTFRPFLYLGLAVSVTLASVGAQSAATGTPSPVVVTTTQAEEMFDDAPYGVDPMVTGPVSAAFKQQQQAAGCDTAVWPNIPAACYPK